MASGIYEIFNTASGSRYVGSAVNIDRRWCRHRYELRSNISPHIPLQRAWIKYGADAFRFNKLIVCSPENLFDYEQRCVDGLKPEYNREPTI